MAVWKARSLYSALSLSTMSCHSAETLGGDGTARRPLVHTSRVVVLGFMPALGSIVVAVRGVGVVNGKEKGEYGRGSIKRDRGEWDGVIYLR